VVSDDIYCGSDVDLGGCGYTIGLYWSLIRGSRDVVVSRGLKADVEMIRKWKVRC